MYSIVLMAAMSAGPGTQGADGASAVVVAPAAVGCAGCCGGYYSSCHGCCGGGFLGHRSGCCGGGLFHHKSRHGCCGGYAYSHSCCGGYGSCYGCGGGFAGCWGGCYGTYTYPSYAPPAVIVPPATVAPVPMTAPLPKPEKTGASLKFHLPAGATLIVDGQPTTGEGTERAFFTPPLAGGQKYFYDVRAEMVIDGKAVVEEKRVVVETGVALTESFSKLIAAAAASTTTIAGK